MKTISFQNFKGCLLQISVGLFSTFFEFSLIYTGKIDSAEQFMKTWQISRQLTLSELPLQSKSQRLY